jgi:hypothetical protein
VSERNPTMGISTRSRKFDVTKGAKGYNELGLPKPRGKHHGERVREF